MNEIMKKTNHRSVIMTLYGRETIDMSVRGEYKGEKCTILQIFVVDPSCIVVEFVKTSEYHPEECSTLIALK